ncbi:unnamed protein product [Psylliodes chrysocephalus]|uniref:HAT C-terminal dimerisation domain-containing protein n=1 Tax=Psylliodes chrysocephalus TaxID=3402493 RepID=A0A9P0GM82_9CUCU|nr:unnamed protein product [Psylliodes chrysocephala]
MKRLFAGEFSTSSDDDTESSSSEEINDNIGATASQLDRHDEWVYIWQIHDEVVETARMSVESGNSATNFPTKLKLYSDQPLANRKIDPIQYWRENESAFPATSKVAFKYLTILGASVPSERLMSY